MSSPFRRADRMKGDGVVFSALVLMIILDVSLIALAFYKTLHGE